VPPCRPIEALSVIVLQPTNLTWIGGGLDEPTDLCAHSSVEFRIGSTDLVVPADGNFAVSAASLYLLRSLTRPHTPDLHNWSQLFPCCGHHMLAYGTSDEVIILGCARGADFEVVRVGEEVVVSRALGDSFRIPFIDWRDGVCGFSDQVRAFYDRSSPKTPSDEDDAKGFASFWNEWTRLRAASVQFKCL
jgi:hypothetical protein